MVVSAADVEEIKGDIKLILYELKGNGKEGMICKVERHERYFNNSFGAMKLIALMGVLAGVGGALSRFL